MEKRFEANFFEKEGDNYIKIISCGTWSFPIETIDEIVFRVLEDGRKQYYSDNKNKWLDFQ